MNHDSGAPEFEVPEARKYPRTYHLPFSPGTTSDDRIATSISEIVSGAPIVLTEKLDGENTCLNARGIFARSHGAPTRNPWSAYLWDLHASLKRDLRSLELFGESLYAVHSIKYGGLPAHFFLFAIRDGDRWLSWSDVVEYAEIIGVATVPVLFEGTIEPHGLTGTVAKHVNAPSRLSASAPLPPSPREGVVIRVARQFTDDSFSNSVFKWVRKGHVQTSEHWSRHWERAYLREELQRMPLEKAAHWLTTPAGESK